MVILFTYNVSDRKLFLKSSRLDFQRSILSESVHSVKCFQATVYGGAGDETPPLLRVLALAEDPDSAPGSHMGVRWLVSVGGLYS